MFLKIAPATIAGAICFWGRLLTSESESGLFANSKRASDAYGRAGGLIALCTECHAISQLGSFGETHSAGRSGIFQGASSCALKIPKGLLKLLI